MRTLCTFLLLCLSFAVTANEAVFRQLVTVNQQWMFQKDINQHQLPSPVTDNPGEWIRHHLKLVEQTLRNRDVSHLTTTQASNRNRTLQLLNGYWKQGNFPINDQFTYRTPIFIDRYDNFCAVGYLVKATGFEGISRMVAAHTNLAYVKEMNYPELLDWASEFGFTEDELAWIQPAYPPVERAEAIGGGTDGEVIELYPDDASDILYVGGKFSTVDGSLAAANIAYIMDHNGVYMWHTMGTGVNGPVHAITKFDNKVFVAGSFDDAGGIQVHNVAYWDGSNWHAAGCTFGTINDLIVYNNELYAVGDFDVCAAMSEVNFAKWDGSMWQQIPGIEGHVNTIEISGTDLILGGDFELMGQPGKLNIVRWNENDHFQSYNNTIKNEVLDIQEFKGVLYASCKQTSTIDSFLLHKLVGGSWQAIDAFPQPTFFNQGPVRSFNTLCAQADTLSIGGDFKFATMLTPGVILQNAHDIFPGGGQPLAVDSTINKMVVFKGRQFIGGRFTQNYSWGITNPLNGIAVKKGGISNVAEIPDNAKVLLYPNPIKSGGQLQISEVKDGTIFRLFDITGKSLMSTSVTKGAVNLPNLSSGTYMVELDDQSGHKQTRQLIIQ